MNNIRIKRKQGSIRIIRKEQEDKTIFVDRIIEKTPTKDSSFRNFLHDQRFNTLAEKYSNIQKSQKNNELLFDKLVKKVNSGLENIKELKTLKFLKNIEESLESNKNNNSLFYSILNNIKEDIDTQKKTSQDKTKTLEEKIFSTNGYVDSVEKIVEELSTSNKTLGDLLRDHIQIFNTDMTNLENTVEINKEWCVKNFDIFGKELSSQREEFKKSLEMVKDSILILKGLYSQELSKHAEDISNIKKDIENIDKKIDNKIELRHLLKSQDDLKDEVKNLFYKKMDSALKIKIDSVKTEIEKGNLSLKELNSRFKKISKSLFDKIGTESGIAYKDIRTILQNLFISDFKKISNKVRYNSDKINLTDEKIKDLQELLNSVEDSLENKFLNGLKTLENLNNDLTRKVNILEKSLATSFKKQEITVQDIEKIIIDNQELFKGEPGRIPNHLVQGDWLFWERPDGTWGQPIRIGNKASMPIYGGSGAGGSPTPRVDITLSQLKDLEMDLSRPVSSSPIYYKVYEYTKGLISKIDFYDNHLRTGMIYTSTFEYNKKNDLIKRTNYRYADGRRLIIEHIYDSKNIYKLYEKRTIL